VTSYVVRDTPYGIRDTTYGVTRRALRLFSEKNAVPFRLAQQSVHHGGVLSQSDEGQWYGTTTLDRLPGDHAPFLFSEQE